VVVLLWKKDVITKKMLMQKYIIYLGMDPKGTQITKYEANHILGSQNSRNQGEI